MRYLQVKSEHLFGFFNNKIYRKKYAGEKGRIQDNPRKKREEKEKKKGTLPIIIAFLPSKCQP